MLGKLERNKLYKALDESDLNPSEFRLTVTDEEVLITHNSGSRFEFKPTTSRVMEEFYSVTSEVADGRTLKYAAKRDIDEMPGRITAWANEIRYTLETPDLWSEMQQNRELIANIEQAGSGNKPFTSDERRQISAQLQAIKERLKEQFELTNEQMEQVEERLDEAAEASSRMGRKDWLIYLLGTITALTIAAAVPSGLGEHIFTVFIHALGHLFTAGTEPPQILSLVIRGDK